MADWKGEFARFLIGSGAFKFGEFVLKSGRKSPYFVNFGVFHDGEKLARLGHFYARAILEEGIEATLLFGPAYKGIPLVCATAIALAREERNLPFAFNRKERKGHGEGGEVIGAPLKGARVLILDDVLTAGTSAREAISIVQRHGGEPVALLVGLDREEPSPDGEKASEKLRREGISVHALLRISELKPWLEEAASEAIHRHLGALCRPPQGDL